MEKLVIDKSVNTPLVVLDPAGRVEIKGVSISENSSNFFEPIVNWIEQYCASPQPQTHIDLAIEYMDSGSYGFFNVVMEKLNQLHISGNSAVNAKWVYEEDDLDMEEYGQDLQRLYKFSVELIPAEIV